MDQPTKTAVDIASTVTVLGTVMNLLPAIAALWTIIWTTIRIYETKTVQDLLKKLKKHSN
jgi:hypothetical protein